MLIETTKMDLIYERLRVTPQALVACCIENHIIKLAVFGSITRDDFDLSRSDVDMLVQFHPSALIGWSIVYIEYDFVRLFKRTVDLLTYDAISKNRRVRILSEEVILYAQ